jgi:hypothetical protein
MVSEMMRAVYRSFTIPAEWKPLLPAFQRAERSEADLPWAIRTRPKIETIIVIHATNSFAVEGRSLEIRFFVRTLSRKGEIFSADERQQCLAPAEIDLFHRTGRPLPHPRHWDVAQAHRQAAAFRSR